MHHNACWSERHRLRNTSMIPFAPSTDLFITNCSHCKVKGERRREGTNRKTERQSKEEWRKSRGQKTRRDRVLQDAVSHVYGYEQRKHNPSLKCLNAFSLFLSLYTCMTSLSSLSLLFDSFISFLPLCLLPQIKPL